MLFQSRFHDPIRRGEITCTVRIWQRPRVRVGKQYRLGAGAVAVDRIQEIDFDALTPALARRSGFASLVDLLKVAKHGSGERVFLVDFHYLDELAASPRSQEKANAAALLEIERKLDAMDRRAKRNWTRATLHAIAENPGMRAADLAAPLSRERADFKRDVRKLKALGLTISLEVGYRLSARGLALLRRPPSKPDDPGRAR
jgi:hypothetical protein